MAVGASVGTADEKTQYKFKLIHTYSKTALEGVKETQNRTQIHLHKPSVRTETISLKGPEPSLF